MESETRKVMGRLNPNFKNFKQPVKSLSGGQRQAVAIARAIHFNARILIMDEPTAALGPAETAQVREPRRQLKDEGIGIFLISHDIHDVFDLSDRISVMYHGKIVGTVNKDDVTTDDVLGDDHPGQEARRGHRGETEHRAPQLARASGADARRPRYRPPERGRQRRVELAVARVQVRVARRVRPGRGGRRRDDHRVGRRLDRREPAGADGRQQRRRRTPRPRWC